MESTSLASAPRAKIGREECEAEYKKASDCGLKMQADTVNMLSHLGMLHHYTTSSPDGAAWLEEKKADKRDWIERANKREDERQELARRFSAGKSVSADELHAVELSEPELANLAALRPTDWPERKLRRLDHRTDASPLSVLIEVVQHLHGADADTRSRVARISAALEWVVDDASHHKFSSSATIRNAIKAAGGVNGILKIQRCKRALARSSTTSSSSSGDVDLASSQTAGVDTRSASQGTKDLKTGPSATDPTGKVEQDKAASCAGAAATTMSAGKSADQNSGPPRSYSIDGDVQCLTDLPDGEVVIYATKSGLLLTIQEARVHGTSLVPAVDSQPLIVDAQFTDVSGVDAQS